MCFEVRRNYLLALSAFVDSTVGTKVTMVTDRRMVSVAEV